MGADQQEALLLAGALLPPGGDRAGDLPLERVRARRYRNPALPGWTVVRLAGETAAAGEDRVLAFLGFEAGEAGEPLARTLRRGLGYVEWVLVHDPGGAEAALAAAAEVQRATRLAPSRPLAATRLFERLAGRVPRTHLPVLWEHAGRAFLAGGGRRRWAAAMFERAREAERVHGLRVDLAARHEACREFAFAGALRASSVARHVAELRRHHPSSEAAWRALLELAPRCVGSGMPPWSALPEQLRRAAREAGREPDAEEARLLGRLLALPATRALHPPGSGGSAARPLSAWAGRRRPCAACCSTCSRRHAAAAATSTAGGWTCWTTPARWTRSPYRPTRYPPRPGRRWAPPAGSAASCGVPNSAGGSRTCRRSCSRCCRGWRRGWPPTASRWCCAWSGAGAPPSTPTSPTPAWSTASPWPTPAKPTGSTCTSGPPAPRPAGPAASWCSPPPTRGSRHCSRRRSSASAGAPAGSSTTC